MALRQVNGIGSIRAKMLIDQFGSAREVFSYAAREYHRRPSLNRRIADSLNSYSGFDLLEEEVELACERELKMFVYGGQEFP